MDQEEERKGKRMPPEPVVSVKLMIKGEILCDRTFTANDEDSDNRSSSSSSSSSNSISETELATPGPGVYAYTGKHDDGPMAPSTASKKQYYQEVARSLKVSESNLSKHPVAKWLSLLRSGNTMPLTSMVFGDLSYRQQSERLICS